MGCGCGGARSKQMGQVTSYELTTPDGAKKNFLTQTEARIAMGIAGGGTIVPIRTG